MFKVCPFKVEHAVRTVTRVYLVHERRVGHEHSEVDVNRRQHAALQLVLSKLHRVHIVELQDQTVNANVFHLLVRSSDSTGALSLSL